MPEGTRCMHIGCGQPASRRLVLRLAADFGGPEAEAWVGLFSCAEHATQALADEMLDTPGFDQVREAFIACGRMPPERECSAAHWVAMES